MRTVQDRVKVKIINNPPGKCPVCHMDNPAMASGGGTYERAFYCTVGGIVVMLVVAKAHGGCVTCM